MKSILNKRLQTLSAFIEESEIVLDIGCDHGLLGIYLKLNRNNIKVISSDINEGPLEKAKDNINKYNLTDEIETRLGDGLDTYSDEIDTIIISGMGGRNMIGIMKSHMEVLKKVDTIILSPNNYQEDVKRFLCNNGFYISNEKLVKEKKFIYQVIVFEKGKERYNKLDYFFGPVLRKNKDKIFIEYFTRELVSREILLKMLPKGYFFKKLKTKKEINNIKEELKDVK
jgi:tRNA (adenine22-N1)-methyltransferase